MKRCAIRPSVLAFLLLVLSTNGTIAQTPAQRRTTQRLHTQAQLLEQQRQLPLAVEKIHEAVRLVPKSDVYLACAAALELQTNQAEKALEHARAATRINRASRSITSSS